jgi:hypothetical protein
MIETLDDVVEDLATQLGVYGACLDPHNDACPHSVASPKCCRVGFVLQLRRRIENAVVADLVASLVGRAKVKR